MPHILCYISNDSTNLPIAFHRGALKGIFESAVGLNFSSLLQMKLVALGKDFGALCVTVCFYPQAKSLSHGSGDGVRENDMFP